MAHDLSNIAGKKIILGLSGGVDSAVAAVLLQDAGASVEALHMTNWEDDDGYCTAADDLQDARRICDQLDIPLHHVNFAQQYRDRVFEYFLKEYRAGRTPNPDGSLRPYLHDRWSARIAESGGFRQRPELLPARSQCRRAGGNRLSAR